MEQPIIRIRFTPDLMLGTVSPSAPQYGGVPGDNRAVQVSFAVPEELQGNRFRYRIEGVDGAGGYVTSGLLPIDDDGIVCLLLPATFTQAGGQLLVRLVVSELSDGEEISTTHSFDGRIYFADEVTLPDRSLLRGSISAMLEDMRKLLEEEKGTFEPKWLSGTSSPTLSTVGEIGQFYRNTSNGVIYECVGVSGNTYTWVKLIRQLDVATAATPGVVAVSGAGAAGIGINHSSGLISICPATEEDIDDGEEGSHPNRPITAGNLAYALRGVTPVDTTIMLFPVSWVGDEAPYTCTQTVQGMTADKKIFVGLDPDEPAAKRELARKACVSCIGQGTNTLTFVADGVKPASTLSLIIREVG